MTPSVSRRAILGGLYGGVAATLPLPILDFLLNENGVAFAKGAPLPVRFGTWFWGLGLVPNRWVPKQTGASFDLTPDLQPLAAFKDRLNVLSGFGVPLDGASNAPHSTGITAIRTGEAGISGAGLPSLDVLIADRISAGSRFASIEIACTNNPALSYSGRSAATPNPSEVDPVSLYRRLFIDGFVDPNKAAFKADPKIMLRRSVLSRMADQRQALMREASASDRARLDQYFTSLRQVETQLAAQLEKPAPAESCVIPTAPKEAPTSSLLTDVVERHNAMVELLAIALACNQSKVFNIALTEGSSTARMADEPTAYHQLTHEEAVDPKLGYQPRCERFINPHVAAFDHLLQTMDGIKEGDGSLLDRSLILAHSDVSDAKTHDIIGIPMITAGRAGGRVRTGQHIAGAGEPVTRVGLTLQQAMGVNAASWGTKSMQTNRTIDELIA